MKIYCFALLLILFTSSNADASTEKNDLGYYTGNKFHELCNQDSLHPTDYCLGLVIGYMLGDTAGRMSLASHIAVLGKYKSEKDRDAAEIEAMKIVDDSKYCLPENGTVAQEYDVIVKYINNHPEQRAEFLGVLIDRAFISAYGNSCHTK